MPYRRHVPSCSGLSVNVTPSHRHVPPSGGLSVNVTPSRRHVSPSGGLSLTAVSPACSMSSGRPARRPLSVAVSPRPLTTSRRAPCVTAQLKQCPLPPSAAQCPTVLPATAIVGADDYVPTRRGFSQTRANQTRLQCDAFQLDACQSDAYRHNTLIFLY